MHWKVPSLAVVVAALSLLIAMLPSPVAVQWRGDGGRDVVYGLTTANELISFERDNPGTIQMRVGIAGPRMVGMDFRPANQKLYGIGETSQVYVIDEKSGAATPVGAPFTPPLEGTEFGVDFNPVVDRIRIVTNEPDIWIEVRESEPRLTAASVSPSRRARPRVDPSRP